uniref:Ribosome receptor lysine/proline rich domain-containing protein n=1 Tax=Ciona savignyi TaxID=51511 RepID=H2Z4D0_CIOSA
MELVDPGLWSMMGFGLAVIAGGLIMAAISFFSMKETSFEDVVAKQRKKKELEDKERSRLNKQKREFFKKKFEIKKKKGNVENGKVAVVTPAPSLVHEVKVVPTAVVPLEEQKKNKKEKATKQGKPSPPKPTKSETPVKPIEAVQVEVSKPVKSEPHLKKVEVVTKVKNAVDNETKPEVKANKKLVAPAEPKSSQKVEDVQKPRQHKVSFSEDFKSGDAGSQPEQKSKKKKGRKQQEEHPIIEAVSSADIDDSTIYYLVEMLNQRLQSANGDWATAGTGISKMQYSELQRKYESREVEIQN